MREIWGPKPFRFINVCVLHPMFIKELKKAWEGSNVRGWAGYIVMSKLRLLKMALKKWNSEVSGNVESKLKEGEDELHKLDLKAESTNLNEMETTRRKELWLQ